MRALVSSFSIGLVALTALLAPACGGSSSPDAAAAADAGATGAKPVISKVEWAYPTPCPPTTGTSRTITVTVTATDADTAAAMLTFTGTMASCGSGKIDFPAGSNVGTNSGCPFAAFYPASVTVTDPQGNKDTLSGWGTDPGCVNGSKTK